MAFDSNRRKQFPKAKPKGPIKLAFGLVGEEAKKAEQKLAVTTPAPPLVFERQEIIGTLYKKGINVDDCAPISLPYLVRIRKNLTQIYEEGKTSKSRSLIDIQNGELLVFFAYDQGTIERVKGLDRNERAWDAEQKCWRVFIGCFDDIFDFLGKGVRITDAAYSAIFEFIGSNYYAHFAKSRFGKLIIREGWFAEFEDDGVDENEATLYLSNSWNARTLTPPEEASLWGQWIESFPFKRTPYSHQKTGIEFLLANPNAALLDEMGCGKTYQIASALGMLMQHEVIDRALIVAPMSLVKTWQNELSMAIDEPYQVISGTPPQRQKALKSSARIFIVHYEGLRLEEERLSAWLQAGQGILVFDESQRIKNMAAQITMAAIRMRPAAKRCVIATGTPIANRPVDLFSQYLVLDQGKTFGKKFQEFKNRFCEMEQRSFNVGRKTIKKEVFIGVRNPIKLRSLIWRSSLRRTKTEVLDLPPVIYKDFVIELSGQQKAMYHQMRDHLKVEISSMSKDEVVSKAGSIAVQLLRLAQIASNPMLLNEEYDGENAKLSELNNLLEDIFSDDTKKVILWSHYVENVNFILDKYQEEYGAVGHTGEMNIEKRQESVQRFQDDPKARLFVATPQSAKEGLTLVPRDGVMVADTMIYLDLSFDSASYAQSQARFHRIGQVAERCLVIHLLADNTVDLYIRKTIAEKISTAIHLLDKAGGVDRQDIISDFDKETLLSIL